MDLLKEFKLALSEFNEILLKHYEIYPYSALESVIELTLSLRKHLNKHDQTLITKKLIEIRDKIKAL